MKRGLAGMAALWLCACAPQGEGVTVEDAWARPTLAGQKVTAAYLRIVNRGSADERLTAVAAQPPLAAMLHTSTSSDGVARMRPVTGGLEIPAGEEVELRPGGSHIMISGLQGALAPGATLPLRLRFERGGEQEVVVRVRSDTP